MSDFVNNKKQKYEVKKDKIPIAEEEGFIVQAKSFYKTFREKHAKRYGIIMGTISVGFLGYMLFFNESGFNKGSSIWTQSPFPAGVDVSVAYAREPCKPEDIIAYKPHPELIFNDKNQTISLGHPIVKNAMMRMQAWRYSEIEKDENGVPYFDRRGMPVTSVRYNLFSHNKILDLRDKWVYGMERPNQ